MGQDLGDIRAALNARHGMRVQRLSRSGCSLASGGGVLREVTLNPKPQTLNPKRHVEVGGSSTKVEALSY